MTTSQQLHPALTYTIEHVIPHLPVPMQNINLEHRQFLLGCDWDESEELWKADDLDDLHFVKHIEELMIGRGKQELWDLIEQVLVDFEPDNDKLLMEIVGFDHLFSIGDFPIGMILFSDGFYNQCVDFHAAPKDPERGKELWGDELPTPAAVIQMRKWWLANGGRTDCKLYTEYLAELEN